MIWLVRYFLLDFCNKTAKCDFFDKSRGFNFDVCFKKFQAKSQEQRMFSAGKFEISIAGRMWFIEVVCKNSEIRS